MLQQKQADIDCRNFWELYDNLCDVIEMINSTFTAHLISVMTMIMTIEIFGGYGFLREVIWNTGNPLTMFGSLLWILFHNALKFTMAYSGSSTTEEAEKSLVLISKLTMTANDHQKHELNFVLGQLMLRNKKFSNIFFTINYKVVLVVSSVSSKHFRSNKKFKITDLLNSCDLLGYNGPV